MSLVAYGSSDEESNASDSEDVDTGVSENITISNRRDGEEEFNFPKEASEPAKEKGLVLPSPRKPIGVANSVGLKSGLSSFLPKPKNINAKKEELPLDERTSFSVEAMAGDDDDEIIDVEEEYEPIAKRAKKIAPSGGDVKPKSVGSLFSLLPAPWQAENTWKKRGELEKNTENKQSGNVDRKRKPPIKIAIPSAPKTDSDDEDNMPAIKKGVAPSEGGSGLKSLLPKPKHSITLKADNPNRPSAKLASRPLIPHTLTKKTTSTGKKPQKTTKKNPTDDVISDDEDEPVSFFTFSEKSGETMPGENVRPLDLKTESSRIKLNEPSSEAKSPPMLSSVDANILSTTTTSQSNKQHLSEVVPSSAMDEPATQAAFGTEENFNPGDLETRTYYYDQHLEQPQPYGSFSANNYENYTYDTSANQPYYSQGPEAYTYTYPTGAEVQTHDQPQDTDIDLEKLQKLKGRRNRKEEVNIVDVNADDQIGNSAEMVAKYGTEEVAHRPSRKKKDMPTAQQRRKHQITYLAFQAKEREFELRQQWSANRQTRRQTQSKYGF